LDDYSRFNDPQSSFGGLQSLNLRCYIAIISSEKLKKGSLLPLDPGAVFEESIGGTILAQLGQTSDLEYLSNVFHHHPANTTIRPAPPKRAQLLVR
jgi:hypothetical protein